MPIRLMCLLFSDDLTVTDGIPLCFLPTHYPQESEFQETASDRSDGRETEDGGLSGTENNMSFPFFSLRSLPHLQLFLTGVVGHRFESGKSFGWNCPLVMEKQLSFLCGEEHICEKIDSACEGMIGFTQLCPQCVIMNECLFHNSVCERLGRLIFVCL